MNQPLVVTVEAYANVHSHIREGDVVGPLVENVVKGGADVILPMPNTEKGLTTAKQVHEYVRNAGKHLPKGSKVLFIPTVMITESTTVEELELCAHVGIYDAKVYPRNRTTKSHNGVEEFSRLLPIVKRCGEVGIKVHFHPENPWMIFNNRDAEFAFLPIAKMFLNETKAKIIWEHGTDSRCIPFWEEMAQTGRFFVTLTAHHLATTEDATFGDVRSICKPPIKTDIDRQGLVDLIWKNHGWVMAGPDDAPHDVSKKHVHEGKCACGAYTAPFQLQLYAHALDEMVLSNQTRKMFEDFMSRNARRLHGLPHASREIKLVRKPFTIPEKYQIGSWTVEPFWAGQTIKWSIEE